MLKVSVTEEFKQQYLKLPKTIRAKMKKQEMIFKENPFHPSLHTEKLIPKDRQIWSIRVDRSYRVLFRFLTGDQVLFLMIGKHDWIYRK
ncbi:MAG: hypothetical protein AAB668_01805 [Patescibacteria group bacterium]